MVGPAKASLADPKPEVLSPAPKTAATPQQLDTKAWLTREESARLLSVTTQTIKNYERKKLLSPQRVSRIIKGQQQDVVVHDPRALYDLQRIKKAKLKSEATTDTSAWLTRNESIDMLGVSKQTLKNYESQGKLHPLRASRRDTRGHEQRVVVYDPKELARLPRGLVPFTQRSAGELEARCFEMFEAGKSFREIVIALRETSDTVHNLHERWLDDGGSFLVISDVSKKDLEDVLGPFKDVTELVELVVAKCSKEFDNSCHKNKDSPAETTL